MSIPRKHVDWEAFDQHKASGGTDADFAKRYGIDPRNFPQYKKSRYKNAPTIVDIQVETVSLTLSGSPEGSPGLLQSAPGSPDIARQSDVDALATRVEVLEAFIATLQQQQTPLPSSPNGSPVVHPVHSGSPGGSPTHKRGFVMADGLFDAIHTYAAAHHVQVKDALDYLVRIGLSQVGQEVDADA